jgi:hypothetical protein
MDLTKIIGELRAELQCLNAAIASMEELARVQSLPDTGENQTVSCEPVATVETPQIEKRRRGRPRKTPLPPADESPQLRDPDSTPGNNSTASAA